MKRTSPCHQDLGEDRRGISGETEAQGGDGKILGARSRSAADPALPKVSAVFNGPC